MPMDRAIAQRLAKISLWVYEFADDALVADGTVQPEVIQIHDDRDPATAFAGIVKYPDKTVLAYQGTITNRTSAAVVDWMQNFRIHMLATERTGLPGMVHEGFFDQLDAIFPKVAAELAKAKDVPLYVTGHSQGGAVAVLATKRLELAGIKVAGTYTFAAPRPGDAVFAASVTTPVFRFEYGNDIVPHVPPPLLPDFGPAGDWVKQVAARASAIIADWLRLAEEAVRAGFRSVGPLTYREVGGPLLAEISSDDEQRLLDERVLNLLKAGKMLGEHHNLSNYIAMLDD